MDNNLEAKVNAICDLLALSFMINDEFDKKVAAVKIQNFEKAAEYREKESRLKKLYDTLLAQFPLPISTPNVEVSDTTKVESSNAAGNQTILTQLCEGDDDIAFEFHKANEPEAGIKNSPSWKEIVQKEVKEFYTAEHLSQENGPSNFEAGMNRAKDYYEKEVVGPLREQSEKRMRALESLTPSGSEYVDDIDACVKCVREQRDSTYRFIGKQNKEISALQEENERLKDELTQSKTNNI